MDKYNEYLTQVNYTEYLISISRLMIIITGLKELYIVNDLDINIDSYQKELNTIEKNVRELQKSGNITIELYQLNKNKVDELIDKINKEYDSVKIVSLYLKKINELINDENITLEEIEEIYKKLVSYIEDLKLSEKEEYQKVYEKYGTLEDRIMIELIAISDMHAYK